MTMYLLRRGRTVGHKLETWKTTMPKIGTNVDIQLMSDIIIVKLLLVLSLHILLIIRKREVEIVEVIERD